MRRVLFSLFLLVSAPAFAEPVSLSADDRTQLQSGEGFTTHPALANLLDTFEKLPDGVIVITHATGEAGQLWAEELQSWLVALGIPSARIIYISHVDLQDRITLDVRSRGDL